jgi:hypothetical protein
VAAETLIEPIPESDLVAPSGSSDAANEFASMVTQIVLFRSLHMRRARGQLEDPRLRARYEALVSRFVVGHETETTAATLARFRVRGPAEIVFADRRHLVHASEIVELGADGAKIVLDAPAPAPDALCWLSVHLLGADGPHAIVFIARVQWAQHGSVALAFCGTPSWDTEIHAQ